MTVTVHVMAEGFEALLERNRLGAFESLWKASIDWVEQPNVRRGGWSGVGRLELESVSGDAVAVFVKRQADHVARSFRHPIRGQLTVVREQVKIDNARCAGVPTQEVLYCAERTHSGSRQGILITRELEAEPLDSWWESNAASLEDRWLIVHEAARVIAMLHRARIQHNALYPKHIFVSIDGDGARVSLIDLEKARRKLCVRSAAMRDLDSLNRRSGGSLTDRMRFLRTYVGDCDAARSKIRSIWRELASLALRKQRESGGR